MLNPIDLPSGAHLMSRKALIDARDLRRRALGVHPANEELRAARIAFVEIGDARAVRRPPRPAALRQKSILRPVRAHDPQLGVEAIFELVDVPARVDDLRPVRRDLRIGDLLEVEVLLDGEERIGLPLLCQERRGRREQSDEQGGSRRDAGWPEHDGSSSQDVRAGGVPGLFRRTYPADRSLASERDGVRQDRRPGRWTHAPEPPRVEDSPTPSTTHDESRRRTAPPRGPCLTEVAAQPIEWCHDSLTCRVYRAARPRLDARCATGRAERSREPDRSHLRSLHANDARMRRRAREGWAHAVRARLRLVESRVRRAQHRDHGVRERLRREAVHGERDAHARRRTASSRSTTTFESICRRCRRSADRRSRSATC